MLKTKLQSLRIEAGWNTAYNQFTELDPRVNTSGINQESSLLMICNAERGKMINLLWVNLGDGTGKFRLIALNYYETFNSNTNNFDLELDWDNPYEKFESKDRKEIIRKIEKWFIELPITSDYRLLVKRGEVDEPSETYRKELLKNGISETLVFNIVANGNQKIQDILLDYQKIDLSLVESAS